MAIFNSYVSSPEGSWKKKNGNQKRQAKPPAKNAFFGHGTQPL
jgi:hypothetical protein